MKFNNILSFVPLLAIASAAPAALERRDNGAGCASWTVEFTVYFNVYVYGDWSKDWGHGLLDNLRGQCGQVSDWGFTYSNQDTGEGYATFDLSIFHSVNCVENAIWLASAGTGAIGGVSCS